MFNQDVRLSQQLLRRGFLVETEGETIFLTDNAYLWENDSRLPSNWMDAKEIRFRPQIVGENCPHYSSHDYFNRPMADHELLNELLHRLGSEGFRKTRQIHRRYCLNQRDRILTEEEVKKLFTYPEVSLSIFRDPYKYIHREFAFFAQTHQMPKMPLSLIEAHVALLVKALSAVGCGVWSACEGHLNKRHVRCELMGAIHALWANYLLKDANQAGYTGFQVMRRHNRFSIVTHNPPLRPHTPQSLDRSRQAAMDIGQYLYTHRLRLREERLVWLQRFRHRTWVD